MLATNFFYKTEKVLPSLEGRPFCMDIKLDGERMLCHREGTKVRLLSGPGRMFVRVCPLCPSARPSTASLGFYPPPRPLPDTHNVLSRCDGRSCVCVCVCVFSRGARYLVVGKVRSEGARSYLKPGNAVAWSRQFRVSR